MTLYSSAIHVQASRMNMEVIPGVLDILPDQMQVVNPALILIFLPIFNRIIYPLLGKKVSECWPHRRRIKTEEKAKVVAASWEA